jgi:hypothetical protein
MRPALPIAAFSIGLLALAAGCGGGSSSPAPTVAPSSTPAASSTTAAISTSSSSSAQVASGGVSATVTIPQVSSGSGTVAISSSTSVLGTSTPFKATRRIATDVGATNTPLFYVELQPSASFSLSTFPSFNVTLPSSDSTTGESFYVAFYTNDPSYASLGSYNTWLAPVIGPATVSGQSLTFTGGGSNTVTLSSSYYYIFCLYETAASSTPSSPPTSSPSTSPSSSPQPTYAFGGSTDSTVVTSGVPLSLSAYHDISVDVTLPAAGANTGTLDLTDALNSNSDITPTLTADNAIAGYTPIVYLMFYNPGSATIDYGTAIPAVAVTDTAGLSSYTQCSLDVYANNGNSGYTWQSVETTSSIVSTQVSFPQGTLDIQGADVEFQAGQQQILAVSCGTGGGALRTR